jgi:Uma2 family endonuclease
MYTKLLKVFAEKRGVRLTYDRGDLEIMAPSYEHDNDGWVLGQFVYILADVLNLTLNAGVSTTLRRKLKRKGIEPDQCFWIASAAAMAGVRQLNLRQHPPPDLAIEIDVSRSSLPRFGIYAALKVPELWRLDGDELKFFALGADKKYTETANSLSFPLVTPVDLLAHLQQARTTADMIVFLRGFRAWAQQRAANPPPPPPPAP